MAATVDPNQISVESKSSPKRLRRLLNLSCLILSILIIFVIVLTVLLMNKKEAQVVKPVEICTSTSCIKAANMILDNMNLDADPCDDFFEFTCGGFVNRTRLADNQNGISTFGRLANELTQSLSDLLQVPITDSDIEAIKNTKRLFNSCLDQINEFDGWPLLDPVFQNTDPNHLYKKMISLFQNGYSQLFSLYVWADPFDPDRNIIRIGQPGWFFPKSYYDNQYIMRSYKDFIMGMLETMNSSYSSERLNEEVDNMIALEKKFAKNLLTTEEKRKSGSKNVTLRELKASMPRFDWQKYLVDGIFKGIGNVAIDDNEPMLVGEWNFISNATIVFADELSRNIKNLDNLFVWTFVKSILKFLPSKYSSVANTNELRKAVLGPYFDTVSQKRLYDCTDFVASAMEFSVGRMYVKNFFDERSKRAAKEMIENIKNEFKIMLTEYDWMDSVSKQAAAEKVDSLVLKIGYPDFTYNDTYMNNFYKEYVFSETDYFENSNLIDRVLTKNNLKEIREKVDKSIWFMGPAEINAYYSASFNEICNQ